METENRTNLRIRFYPLAETVQSNTHEVAAQTLNRGIDCHTLNLAEELVIFCRVADPRIGVFPQAFVASLKLGGFFFVACVLLSLGLPLEGIIRIEVLLLFVRG